MRRRDEAEAMVAGVDHLVGCKATGRASGKILEVHEDTDLAAGRLRPRGDRQPIVEGSTFIHLEMAPTDPANRRRIKDTRNGVPYIREHTAHSGMEEERLLVPDQEVIELEVNLRNVDGDAEQVGGNFVDARHELPPVPAWPGFGFRDSQSGTFGSLGEPFVRLTEE